MADYVELRAVSAFSFLAGSSQPEEIVDRAEALGYRAMALADADGVYAVPRFAKACRGAGIRPIVGATVTLDLGDGLPTAPLLLLCRDVDGWQNLCEMITESRSGRQKDDAQVDLGTLERLSGGLVAIGGGMDGPVIRTALARGKETANAIVDRLSGIFGRDRLFLDVQRHGDPFQERANRFLMDLAASRGLSCVATNDVRYATPDRSRVFDVFTALRHHTTLDEAGLALTGNHQQHIKRPSDMRSAFADHPILINDTIKLAESLEFSLKDTGYRFPRFQVPHGETEFSVLYKLTQEGVQNRYRPVTPKVVRQITHELSLIEKLDLAGYFLLVHDITRFCRENDILAQGRGSAANSAVCYSLQITAVDPIAMELLFERFLSEERGEWPDIDLDLPSGEDREKVIQYVYGKYGARSVGMTSAVISYRGRLATREVGKVFGLDPDRIDRLSRLVSHYGYHEPDEGLLPKVREVGLDPDDIRVSGFIDVWGSVRRLPRHLGQHNGGMVITGGRLDRTVPLEPARMPGRMVIQWDKDDLAELGIIKVDLLGLGMLAVLHDTIGLIDRHEGVTVDLAHLPPDDPATYHMLRTADTVGVFQVESRAQMATLPRLRPERFYDLVVEVAIIRPGPIVGKMVHPYLERRAGRAPVIYDHPVLQPILGRTLGVPLFQEQLMRMAMAVAGFTGGEAEELRRAMGSRRSQAQMDRLTAKMRTGMTAHGISSTAQDRIIASIGSFALYGFPESHAASFALIAYASAYLKRHYPAAFLTALLNRWPMGFYAPSTLVHDAKLHGVEVRPISIGASRWECTLEAIPAGPRMISTFAVRLGLKYVKGLSEATGKRIVFESGRAPFDGIGDVGTRTGASSAEMFALAETGVLGERRRDAMWQALALDGARGLLRGAFSESYDPAIDEMDMFETMTADFDGTGLSVGPHPMAFLRARMDELGVITAESTERMRDGTRTRVAGMVIVRQRPGTAKGMYFATIEDETGMANLAVRPELFRENRSLLSTAPLVLAEGVIRNRDGVASLSGERFWALR